jgi:hypothetical protein
MNAGEGGDAASATPPATARYGLSASRKYAAVADCSVSQYEGIAGVDAGCSVATEGSRE